MANGRCRLHGGLSTGPRTSEGKERARLANWKHGLRSEAYVAEMRQQRAERRARGVFLDLLKTNEIYFAVLERLAEKVDAGDARRLIEMCLSALGYAQRLRWVRETLGDREPRWAKRLRRWLEAGVQGATPKELVILLAEHPFVWL